MTNLFAAAKAKAPPVKAAAKKKDTKEQVDIVGLEELAQVDALIKVLTGVKAVLDAEVKTEIKQYFLEQGQENSKQPENFRGIDGNAAASCELRKRSTTSVLTPEQEKMLKDLNIPFDTKVSVPFLFAINPKYANDDKMLEKVSKAIARHVPDDFITTQQEVSAAVVSDATIAATFALGAKLDETLLETVSVFAVKPSLSDIDLPAIMAKMTKMITPEAIKEATTEKPRATKATAKA